MNAIGYADRVLETSTTKGTGTLTLAGAVPGYQSFSAAGLDGQNVPYLAYEVDSVGNPTGAWEVGLGLYTASGTTLTRAQVLASSNGGSAVNFANSLRVALVSPAAKASLPDVQIFTSSGTWNMPPGCSIVEIMSIGGGAGGGSGRRGAANSNRGGGGGGSGGCRSLNTIPASQVPSSVSVTVGIGGPGGASVATDDTNGNAGSKGGTTSFGTLVKAPGGANEGGGGTTTGGTAGGSFNGEWAGGSGAAGGANGAAGIQAGGSNAAANGGGGGGGITSGNVANNGGAGAPAQANWPGPGNVFSAAGTVGANQNGGAGSSGAPLPFGGGGGGGGAASITGPAGSGGAGGNYGGGGGGGGASLNGNASGAGGAGAPGICVVVAW